MNNCGVAGRCEKCERWQRWLRLRELLRLPFQPVWWRLSFDDGQVLWAHGMTQAWEAYWNSGYDDHADLDCPEDWHSTKFRWPNCEVEIFGLELN